MLTAQHFIRIRTHSRCSDGFSEQVLQKTMSCGNRSAGSVRQRSQRKNSVVPCMQVEIVDEYYDAAVDRLQTISRGGQIKTDAQLELSDF
jgi:hypothetical protein